MSVKELCLTLILVLQYFLSSENIIGLPSKACTVTDVCCNPGKCQGEIDFNQYNLLRQLAFISEWIKLQKLKKGLSYGALPNESEQIS